MSSYRGFALGVAAWVVVVTAGAALVWTVISQAGAGVAGDLPVAGTTPAAGQQTSSPAPDPAPPAGGGPSTSAPPTGGGPSTSAPATGGPAAKPVRRTWNGAAGLVVAECRRAAIDFVSAQPSSGWSIEVEHTGPDDVRVEFEADEAKVRVEAVCVDGVPSFTVTSEGAGESD